MLSGNAWNMSSGKREKEVTQMKAILQSDIDEIRRAWEHCGFSISECEIFKIAEEVRN